MSAKRAAAWYRWDQVELEDVNEKLSRRLITGDQVMLTHVYLKKGCIVPKHSHMNEQFTYILEGALKFFVGDEAAASAGQRAPRGARAGGYARRGCVLSAARGLAEEDRRLPQKVVDC